MTFLPAGLGPARAPATHDVVALCGRGWHNKGLFLSGFPERKVSEPVTLLGASIKVYETVGFNNPAGWASAAADAVNLLEPADAFNIPVPV